MTVITTPILSKAIVFATHVHAGQTDIAGDPYILHVLRVMMAMKDESTRIVAVLHDVLEDTGAQIEELRGLGIPWFLVDPIGLLTRGPETDTDSGYLDYICRLKGNEIARIVKIADLKDNLDITRLHRFADKDRRRIEKYLRALRILQEGPL